MKPFDELTDAEILALTDDQIDYYIDRTCAEEGVALVPPTAPPAPTKPPIENDVSAYKVAGVILTSMGEAERLRDVLRTMTSRVEVGYGGGRHWRQIAKPVTDPIDVDPVSYLSERRAAEQNEAIIAFEEAQKQYQTDKAAYDKAVEGRERVGAHIQSEVRRVRREDYERQELLREFDRYVALADGDRRIAWRFLCRVRSRAEALLPDLSSELGGPDVVCASAEAVVAVGDDIQF